MKLSPFFTTVTTFSRLFALVLFIILPCVGFYFGFLYQRSLQQQEELAIPIAVRLTPKTNEIPRDWVMSENYEQGIVFAYPYDYVVETVIPNEKVADFSIRIIRPQDAGQEYFYPAITIQVLKTPVSAREYLETDCPYKTRDLEQVPPERCIASSDASVKTINESEFTFFANDYTSSYQDHAVIQKNGHLYIFSLTTTGNGSIPEEIFFQLLDTVRFMTGNESCAKYTHLEKSVLSCANCGNDVCELYEHCTPSIIGEDVQTADCGLLYCPADCN